MNISPVTQEQMKKVVKALIYAFVSGFTGTLSLFAADFLKAAQEGVAEVNVVFYALVAGAFIGGINAVAVYVKQLFSEE